MAGNVRIDTKKLEQAMRKAAEPALRNIARDMERVLADLGRRHKGNDLATIKAALTSAFRRKGWTITDPELTRFATAISEGTKIDVNAKAF